MTACSNLAWFADCEWLLSRGRRHEQPGHSQHERMHLDGHIHAKEGIYLRLAEHETLKPKLDLGIKDSNRLQLA